MAKAHSGDAYFAVDDEVPALKDLSQYVTEVAGYDKAFDPLDDTGLGHAARVGSVGLEAVASIVARGIWDDAADASHDVLAAILGKTTARTVTYGPEGSAGGDVRLTAECFHTRYVVEVRAGERATFEAEFRPTVGVTVGTF